MGSGGGGTVCSIGSTRSPVGVYRGATFGTGNGLHCCSGTVLVVADMLYCTVDGADIVRRGCACPAMLNGANADCGGVGEGSAMPGDAKAVEGSILTRNDGLMNKLTSRSG